MIFRDWIKMVDSMDEIHIYMEDEDDPIFKGHVFDIPWTLIDLPFAKRDKLEPPVHIWAEEAKKPYYVVVLSEDEDDETE